MTTTLERRRSAVTGRQLWQKHGAAITVLTFDDEYAGREPFIRCALCGAACPRHDVAVRTRNAGGLHVAEGRLCDGCLPCKGEAAPRLPCVTWGVTPEQWQLAQGWDLRLGEYVAVPCPEHGPQPPVAAARDAYRLYTQGWRWS